LDTRLAKLRGQGVSMKPYDAAETVVTLVGILGLHDKRTRGHSERVRAFTDLLTGELGLPEQDRVRLRWAALVHDLGKLSVPAPVLNSPGGLDESSWELMHRHPDEGVRLLGGLLPWLGEWGDAIGQHHERYDGTGYPSGLAGEDIAYAARIVALADSFEVMTSARSYKAARSAAWAREELTRCAGSQFDPALVRAFLGISIGRIKWVLGPVTWLAELPFVATADRAGQTVKVASVTALAAGLVAVGAMPQGGAPVPLPPGSTTVAVEAGTASGEQGQTAAGSDVETGDGDQAAAAPAVRPSATPTRSASPAAPASTGQAPAGTGAVSTGRRTARAPEPAPTPSPRPGASAPAGASAPSPTPGPALAPVYYLTSRGLQRSPASAQEVMSIRTGSTVTFDARLDRPVLLPATRELVVFVRFPTTQGNAKVGVALQDCAGSRCTVLSEGLVAQDKRSTSTYQRYTVPLVRSGQDVERVPAGHVLRLALTFLEPGAKGPGRVAMGGSATPSRLLIAD
ncbi:MAG: HD domain-containing protein, partial [Frankiales bacterium]